MSLNFVQKLDFNIQKTNIRAQKIYNSALNIFKMIIADFQIKNKANKSRFFQKIFLVNNTKFAVILRIFFFNISNTNVSFD